MNSIFVLYCIRPGLKLIQFHWVYIWIRLTTLPTRLLTHTVVGLRHWSEVSKYRYIIHLFEIATTYHILTSDLFNIIVYFFWNYRYSTSAKMFVFFRQRHIIFTRLFFFRIKHIFNPGLASFSYLHEQWHIWIIMILHN